MGINSKGNLSYKENYGNELRARDQLLLALSTGTEHHTSRRWIMFRNSSITASIVLIVLCAIGTILTQTPTLTSDRLCLNRPRPAGYYARNNITIAANAWTSSILGAQIANILLDEVIGVQNQILFVDQIETWDQISKGQMHMLLEYWPTDRAAEEQKYIYTDMTVTFAGPVGMVGQIGWYVPRYVLSNVPNALFGDFSDPQVSSYFNHTLIIGDKDWLGVEQKVIDEQHFALNIEYLASELELTALIEDRFANTDPMLFYFWKPHTLSSVFDMMRVQLPNDSIYYPPQILGKMMWSKLPDYSPESAFLAQSFSLSDNQMTELLSFLYKNGSSWDTACKWVQENEHIWENWIRPSSFKEVGLDLQIAMWVLSGLCVSCTVFYLIVTLKYRKSKVIIASSGVFLISMCIGGMLMFGSVIAFVSNTMIGCNLFIWMLPVGFALLFGSLFAKTGRIYLLFSNKSLQLVKYTDRDVGFGVGVILLGECIILAVMMGLQPASFEFQHEGDSQFSFCLFHFPTGITLLVFNGIVMVFGIIISALVSRLRLTLYNEAKYIGWAMYNFGFIVIFVAVIFLVTDVIVRFALLCCCILFLTMTSLSVLFIPKIKLLFTYSEEELREMNEAQLQAVIRSYTKKFASSSDRKKSTRKGTTTGTGSYNGGSAGKSGSVPMSTGGSSFEDEMANLASSVKSMSDQIKQLKSENKKLRETTSDDYRSLYEKFYHENMILKNEIFELKGRLTMYEQCKPEQ